MNLYSKTSLDRISRDPLYFADIAEIRYSHFIDSQQWQNKRHVINDLLEMIMRAMIVGNEVQTITETRPIRLTMRPHDDGMIVRWCNFMRFILYLLLQLFAWKCWFSLFLTKAWRTNRRTDRRTDGRTDGWTDRRTDVWTDRRTDRPSYRDARTHQKIKFSDFRLGQF